MAVSFGVRKGAWTEEEDSLLRKCVEEYGEAKWHQVPARAGLNRCRKSCRLRWLNYLRPNIKRGEFTEDEVDLMFKLHKLLGNRWSLIAGRLPGRTANDVKNYWNSHIRKKIGNSCYKDVKPKAQNQKTEKVNIIKPRPRTLSGNSTWLKGKTTISDNFKPPTPFDDRQPETESETVWWAGLARGNNQFHHGIDGSTLWSEGESIANLLAEKSYPGTTLEETFDQVGQGCETDDFPFDAELWDLLNADQGSLFSWCP